MKLSLNLIPIFMCIFFAAGCKEKEYVDIIICNNTCNFSNDGECDDGGEGSDSDYCKFGSDCYDCGERIVKQEVK